MITVQFKKLLPEAKVFAYSRQYDACMDMYSVEGLFLEPGETRIVKTGIAVKIPPGFEGQVRGRSGLASKGISVHLGTVDETYTGDVGIIMTNTTPNPFPISVGDRVGQFTVKRVDAVQMIEVPVLPTTERGSNGFGSSGL